MQFAWLRKLKSHTIWCTMKDISVLVRYEGIHGHNGHYLTFKPPCRYLNVSTWFINNVLLEQKT
jgi:hypothetical protein